MHCCSTVPTFNVSWLKLSRFTIQLGPVQISSLDLLALLQHCSLIQCKLVKLIRVYSVPMTKMKNQTLPYHSIRGRPYVLLFFICCIVSTYLQKKKKKVNFKIEELKHLARQSCYKTKDVKHLVSHGRQPKKCICITYLSMHFHKS